MKIRWAILCTTVALGISLSHAQIPDPDLPAAPSATKDATSKAPPAQQRQPGEGKSKPQTAPAPESTPAAQAETPSKASEQQAKSPSATDQESPDTSSESTTSARTDTQPGSSTAPTQGRNDVDESLTTIKRHVDEVNVVFTVTDKHGRYVRDLHRDDFKVVDDRKPAEQIRSFSSQTDLPLQVGLLIDASNSVRDRFKFEQESAIQFLNQTVRQRYDKAFVIGFDVTPEVTQDFTDNTESLSRGVRALRPGGGTAMYDALYYACRDKLAKVQQAGPVRRAIILLSDGEDNQSHVTREEAIEMAQRVEVIIYTISTNVSGMKHQGDKVLERIAEATGGRAFFPFQIRDVADAFAEIQDELRSQYAISYKPADFAADGRYRTIEILAQNHKGLHVRARRGYFAPSQ